MSIREFVGDKASDLFTSEVKCSCPSGTRGNKVETVSVDQWHTAPVNPTEDTTVGVNEGGGEYNG